MSRLPLIDQAGPRTRGVGVLSVTRDRKRSPLPLAKVEIAARVADRVAQVTVSETFHNPYTEPLEAVYIFPLGGGSAVSDFELKVGNRVIKGRIDERAEARRKYQQALDEGKRAALLEQERDDIFTVQVGNLPPGEEVVVRLTYSERLAYFEDGTSEIRLPLVVAPRYIAGRPVDRDAVGDGIELDSDRVPDASRITPPRLAPGFDPKVGLSIEVELAGNGYADLACSQHASRLTAAATGVRVALAREDEPLDRDFVLRWRLAVDHVLPTGRLHKGYGMLSIIPPRREGFLGTARDVVFVLDHSGSMGGVKMASAARACSILLATLGPRDRYAIQAFDDSIDWMDGKPTWIAADEAGLERGEKFLRSVQADGGTEVTHALDEAFEALGKRPETSGRVPVVVLLTDGEVGDESSALKSIQKDLGDARLFTIGIDTAVNEGFLKRAANLGGGTSTFVVPGEALEDALRAVGREIGTPLVTDVTIEDVDAGLDAATVAPARIPDLFTGRATAAFFAAKRPGRVRVRGKLAEGGVFDQIVELQEVAVPALAHLWARARVTDLEDQFRLGAQDETRQEIIRISIAHSVLTRFTAFVVVDESEIVNPDGSRRKVVQPVAMPDRWEMESETDTRMMTGAGMGAMPIACSAPAPTDMIFDDLCMKERCEEMPPSKSRGSIMGRLFSGGGKKDAAKKAKSSPTVDKTERERVEKALRELVRALDACRSELAAGRVPSPDALEKARAELMKSLSSDLGTRMPKLQRFLRSAMVEIIAALRSGLKAALIVPVLDRHAKALDEAKAETGDPKFWEASI